MSVSLEPAPPPRGEDLPYDDGEPMDTQRHRDQMNLLIDTLTDHVRAQGDVYVAGNMALYFSERQARNNDFRARDVFVVTGVDPHERRSWVVWEEHGRRPDVVIELLSPSTEAEDRGPKMRIYERLLSVSVYVMFDPFTARLEGYHLVSGLYVPLPADVQGRIPIAPLAELSLGVVPSEALGYPAPCLRWIDAQGAPLPTARERASAAEANAAQARSEIDQLRARAERAEAELAALRARSGES